MIINPLRAKFFRENINIYSHFMSLLHIDMTRTENPSSSETIFYIVNIMAADVLVM